MRQLPACAPFSTPSPAIATLHRSFNDFVMSPPNEHPWFDWRTGQKSGYAAIGAFLTGSPSAKGGRPPPPSLFSASLCLLAKGPLVALQHAVPITMVGAITERVLTYSRSLHEESDLVLVGHADAAVHLNAFTGH